MIDKIKKSVAVFLSSFMAFGGLVSAMNNSEAIESNSQTVEKNSQATVLPVQQHSLPPINITVINEESAASKLLAATKIAFLGTSTIGVGACCYKVYKVVDNTGNNVQEILKSTKGVFDVTKADIDDILKTFNKRLDNILGTANLGLHNIFERFGKVLAALPEDQARQLISDIHNILSGCGDSVDVVKGLLSRLDVEKINGIPPAIIDMINAITNSINDVLRVNPEQGSSLLTEILTVLVSKPNANVSSENSAEDTTGSKAEKPGLIKSLLRWYVSRH